MSTNKQPYGKPVKLQVDLQGFPDGRVMLFEIWRKEGPKEEKIAEVSGVTRGGKGLGEWAPQSKGGNDILPLVQKVQRSTSAETYYFIGKIDDQQAKSKDFEFTYVLDVYVVDTEEKPIDDVEFTITLSDGTKKKGTMKNGRAKIEDATFGKFQIELDGYDFVF
jgi:hypothetical protein